MTNRKLRADSLAVGISVVLVMTIVQRGIGFVRGIWFCRLLDDARLGQWAIGFGFISLVTPMLLFGLPGSMPRFIEAYLQKGQLRGFLMRILGLTGLVSVLGISALLLLPAQFGSYIFGDNESINLVVGLAFAVSCVIVFNVTNEVLAGMRLVRVGQMTQFVNSVAFTALGVLWLYQGGGIAGLLVMFGVSSMIGTLPAWWVLARGWQPGEHSSQPFSGRSMWRRVIPYAAAIWAMNLLSNSFELADRYMLLHLADGGGESGDAQIGQRLLGQYHSSLLIPYLFISLANMASSMLTPYLVVDWERGAKEVVAQRLEQFMVWLSTTFTLGAAVALMLVPFVFQRFLQGRYDGGLEVMPICFLFCVWFAIATLAQAYLWVSEKGKLVAIVMALGLLTNVALNAVLVPRVGLNGAVWGTCLAHFAVLTGTWWAIGRCGYKLNSLAVWITLLPTGLLAGPVVAMLGVAIGVLASPKLRRYYGAGLAAAGCQFRAFAR